MAELFDLPVDVVAGLPRLELIGNRQLYLERHTGLLAYSDTQIDANTGFGVLRIRGERLTLVAMTGEELRIGGKIDGVEWVSVLKELINRARGQVWLRVTCPYPERVLNLCSARKLAFWDLEWEGAETFTCRMSRRDHRILSRAAEKLDCTIEIVRREGAPYTLAKLPAPSGFGGRHRGVRNGGADRVLLRVGYSDCRE
ncbi:MAG: sporulation protein YqfD [Dysosmobacter sp.]